MSRYLIVDAVRADGTAIDVEIEDGTIDAVRPAGEADGDASAIR